jgi:hypothetical protein
MITNVFVENDMVLINYLPLAVGMVVALMLVMYTMEMIFLFYDDQLENLDRYSFHHLRRMVLDMKCHGKMIDQYFDYTVDNPEELEMDHNDVEMNFEERLNYRIRVVRLRMDRKNQNHTLMIMVLN